ncbi:hypothetical protein MAR_007217 [Mya arenaria]|uniref:Uncharacterized protein n=1 Tax=Mya arenaria TaxID=6604 RepID=A0ABY7DDQ3_MYAAR|nr:hypothetical protein MAR_007217 [Mya arenaria]
MSIGEPMLSCSVVGDEAQRETDSGQQTVEMHHQAKGHVFLATVVISGVLPRAQSSFKGMRLSQSFLRAFNNTAEEVNRSLQMIENEVPWLKYMEVPGFTTAGGIDSKLLSRDGLHLSFLGTETVAS